MGELNSQDLLRLQVFLSHNGVCSRRKAMDVIKEGRVQVNGRVCKEPSFGVDGQKDRVSVDGQSIFKKRYEYLVLNKPSGYVTTKGDRHAKQTVIDLLPSKLRHLHPVGRLDKDTEGLLILTNDGDVTHALTHPHHQIEKVYVVKLNYVLKLPEKMKFEKGVFIDGKRTLPAKVHKINRTEKSTDYCVTIREGKKRQIRIMFARLGYKVLYLKRTQQGPIKIGKVRKGDFRTLTKQEINDLSSISRKN